MLTGTMGIAAEGHTLRGRALQRSSGGGSSPYRPSPVHRLGERAISKIAGALVLVVVSALIGAQWPKEAEAQTASLGWAQYLSLEVVVA